MTLEEEHLVSPCYASPKTGAEGFTIVVADTEQKEGLSSAHAMEALRVTFRIICRAFRGSRSNGAKNVDPFSVIVVLLLYQTS